MDQLEQIWYSSEACHQSGSLDETIRKDGFYWVNVFGVENQELNKKVLQAFDVDRGIRPKLNQTALRPKLEEFSKEIFFTLKSVEAGKEKSLFTEQIHFILGQNYLLSFQEKAGDHFDDTRAKIIENIGVVRQNGTDYLLKLLLEDLLDNYYETLHEITDQVDLIIDFEKDESLEPQRHINIEFYKKRVSRIKRLLTPLKDALIGLEDIDHQVVDSKTRKYFIDLKDQTNILIEDCEFNRVRLESASNLFYSLQSHKMNESMRVLTIVTTLFIPLTFIVGLYGMNFTSMPELEWKFGYIYVWVLLFVALLVSIWLIRNRKL